MFKCKLQGKEEKILNLPRNSYHHEAGLSLQCNQGNSVECSLLLDQPEKQRAQQMSK